MSNSGKKMSTPGWCTFGLLSGVLVVAFGAFVSATPQNKSTATHFQDAKKTASSKLAVQAKAVAAKLKSVDRKENSSATMLTEVQTGSSPTLSTARLGATSAASLADAQKLRRTRPGTLPSSGATRTAQSHPECAPGAGNCCTPGGNGTPGCDDEACCHCICTCDPFCCDNDPAQPGGFWDGLCAGTGFEPGCGAALPDGLCAIECSECLPGVCGDGVCDPGENECNCPADCPGPCVAGSCMSQLPNQVNGLFSDVNCAACGTGTQVVADNFIMAVDGSIDILRFWGGYFTQNIPENPDCFTVIFYADAGGTPGGIINQLDCVAATSRVDTGIDLFAVDEYEYEIDLNPNKDLAAGTYWVSIHNDTLASDEWFWETGDLDPALGIVGSVFAVEFPVVTWMPVAPVFELAFEVVCKTGTCGENGCEDGENSCNCPEDCLPAEFCGNGICCAANGEDCVSCTEDCGPCPPECGDGNCDPDENECTCPQDCLGECACIIFTNQAEFEAFNAAEGKTLKGIEDFEEGTLLPGAVDGMEDPLCGGVPNAPDAVPYPEGLTQLNMCVQSNTLGEFPTTPSPHSAPDSGLAAASAGFLGMVSDVVLANTFVDSWDLMLISPPVTAGEEDDHTGVGFNGVSSSTGTANIQVFNKANVLLVTATMPVSPSASAFWGIWCSDPIGRINIFDTSGGAEAADNIQLWHDVTCVPPCVAPATCIDGACCGDGVVEGHEECDYGTTGCGTCPTDGPVNGPNGSVGAEDLAFILGNWGSFAENPLCNPDCPPELVCIDDLDPPQTAGNQNIGPEDLAKVLGTWGDCPLGFGEDLCVEGDCDAICECVGRGACCGVKGDPAACDELSTVDECAVAGGTYQGDDTTCADCPHPACANAEGDCCEANFTPGCDDPDCCAAVCALAPLCCDEGWDALCAGLAADECAAGCPIPFDSCDDPGVIFDGDTPYDTTGGVTDGSLHAGCMFDGQTYHDIWFNYDATCTGDLTVTTCEDDGGSAIYDTDLVVYDGCFPVIPCPPTDADLLDCNDDSCSVGFHSFLQVPVVANDCYTIRVGGWNDGDQGSGVLHLDCVQATVCGDNVCEGAEDCCNCPADCGACVCGDGTCEDCESNETCHADCDPVTECVHDDGGSENSLGLGALTEFCWIQVCDGGGGAVDVVSIQTTYGTPAFPGGTGLAGGDPVRVYVWSDPNQDGSPSDAVLVCESSAAIEAGSIDTDVFQTIDIVADCGSVAFGAFESFFIGASVIDQGGGFFTSPMDESEPLAHQSWVHSGGPPFDPNTVGGADNMDAIGFPADWMLRANFSLATCGEFGCEPGENSCNCPGDCGAEACGNGICCGAQGEDCNTCQPDCGDCPFCGDGSCNGDEDCSTCDADCGVCVGCDICFTNCDDITGPGAPCIDNGADDWMSNVTFAGINNSTGTEGCPCSYGNHSALQASVVAGQTYDLTVSFCSDAQWEQHVRAWFDWNGNLDYECDESVFLGFGIDATVTAPVLVPAGTPSGCYSMRVIEEFFDDPGCSAACTGQIWGEAEDYTVCVE
ncbi:MAG: GEVED domain-containing protein [Planctomycetota bacterium]|nr:GEVED domain-containing protein [Planctomycetota bacterium]